MLDFAIFAVTFLLALVGAVLYLYPVTAGRTREPRPPPASAGLAGRTSRSRGLQRAAEAGPGMLGRGRANGKGAGPAKGVGFGGGA